MKHQQLQRPSLSLRSLLLCKLKPSVAESGVPRCTPNPGSAQTQTREALCLPAYNNPTEYHPPTGLSGMADPLISSLYPPPPAYYKLFTQDNLERAREGTLDEKHAAFLTPPQQPEGETYRSFGNVWDVSALPILFLLVFLY